MRMRGYITGQWADVEVTPIPCAWCLKEDAQNGILRYSRLFCSEACLAKYEDFRDWQAGKGVAPSS